MSIHAPSPVDQVGLLAQNPSGFEAAPDITNMEQGLLGRLGTPNQQILGDLPLQQFTGSPAGAPANLAGPANQLDPLNLISPVINGLGTLGTGQFSGPDPTQLLGGISNAFDDNAMPLQQAMGSAANDWQGQSGTAANAATQAALTNGAQVANQANGLANNLSTAASNVAQTRQQMMDIIDEFQAKMAATDVSTPDGKAAALAAANQANTHATAVMQELQGNLGSHADQASAIGAPVGVAPAPTAGTSMVGGPNGSMLASADPTGAPSTAGSNPPMNINSIGEDLKDLLFLPLTLTQLNQNMMKTNSIMSGLGNTLTTTNGTIGNTNSIMTGLGNTLTTTNTALGGATRAINSTTGALNTTNAEIPGLQKELHTTNGEIPGLNNELHTTNGEITPLSGALDQTNKEITPLSGALGQTNKEITPLSGALGQTNREITPLNGALDQTNKEITPLNTNLSDTNGALSDLNTLNPESGKFFGHHPSIPGTAEPVPNK